ncbi:proton-conducting transporter transmembrane domain-containing protein [Orenia marismortui]|uniref:proton-conducting transporter transmembrane domain-containing protein n=1 Tax=Orenia marismortui TaxID=46469 RepID=UPI00038096B0|nr:proton-conducting transporter membrane subunit [Orenia marismortui]
MNPGVIYFFSAIILYFSKDRLRQVISVLTSIFALIIIYKLSPDQQIALPFLDFNLVLLKVDHIGKLIALIFSFFALCSTIYALKLADKKYYLLANIYIGSSIAILFVGDLFSFYVLWEMMTISSYFLIFTNKKPITKQTSYYYFMMHMVGAISLLWGILLQYNGTGSILLANVEYGIPFFLLAVGIKLAFIGLHTWLPQNYANVPFYISVLLSAYTTKVGVYALYRLLGGINLGYAGIITAIVGVFLALRQTQVRKLLSYHIISQIGYMITAIGAGNSLGLAGGVLHLINNVLYKGLLFMVIGVVIYTTEKEDLIDLGGLFKRLPIITFYALVAALSIAGVPFFSGHVSKLLIKKGIDDPILRWGLYIAGIGTALSFLKVIYFAFFKGREEEVEIKRRPPKSMLLSMGMITALIILIGVKPSIIKIFFNFEYEVKFYSLHYIWKSLQPIILALVIFKLAHDLIEPHSHQENNFDIYPYFGKVINYLSMKLSELHNGDLSRYMLWLISTLIFLLVKFLI